MANNFLPWVDTVTSGQNVQSASDFAADSQRKEGFVAGTPASALRVNSGLRQANLVAAAVMQVCENNGINISNLDLTSVVSAVATAINSLITTIASAAVNTFKTNTYNQDIADINTELEETKTLAGKHITQVVNSGEGNVVVGGQLTDDNQTLSLTMGTTTDTGATSVEVTGSGNAVTNLTYDSTTRKLTANKDTTFPTSKTTFSYANGVLTITEGS